MPGTWKNLERENPGLRLVSPRRLNDYRRHLADKVEENLVSAFHQGTPLDLIANMVSSTLSSASVESDSKRFMASVIIPSKVESYLPALFKKST